MKKKKINVQSTVLYLNKLQTETYYMFPFWGVNSKVYRTTFISFWKPTIIAYKQMILNASQKFGYVSEQNGINDKLIVFVCLSQRKNNCNKTHQT